MSKYKELPSLDRLNELFAYNSDTGSLVSKVAVRRRPIGSLVGSQTKAGYLQVNVDNSGYLIHRLVWKMHYGTDPGDKRVDHIDGNILNNRINNLRLVSIQENAFNTHKAKGYSFYKRHGKYMAYIHLDGKRIHLGYYDCPLLARLAYEDAKSELHKIP
jgi:hypothetical protein